MANLLTKSFFEDMLQGYKELGTSSNLKVMLLTSSAIVSSSIATLAEVEVYEVTGVGYTTGGKAIENVDISDQTKLIGDNVQWAASTITARYAVLYDDTETLSTNKRVIAIYDFGGNMSSNNSIFEISWNTNGIINLAQQI